MGQGRDKELELAAGFSTWNLVGGSRGKEELRNSVPDPMVGASPLNVGGSRDGEG